jgi:hypothetical protein
MVPRPTRGMVMEWEEVEQELGDAVSMHEGAEVGGDDIAFVVDRARARASVRIDHDAERRLLEGMIGEPSF